MQCRSKSALSTSEDKSGPAIFMPEQIGLNQVKVQGRLIKENNEDYFLIDKVLLRGRSAPVISPGQKIKLNNGAQAAAPCNRVTKGLLHCQFNPETEDCIWSFKPIGN